MSKSLPICELVNSVILPELRDAAAKGVIADVEILETQIAGRGANKAPSYFVAVRMHWSGDKTWYLTTRRHRSHPKLFRQLSVLLELLRDIAPDPLTLHRDVELPLARPSGNTPPAHLPAEE